MFTWEVIFRPDKSIDVQAETDQPGSLRVEFKPARGSDISTEPLAGGAIRTVYYGKLRIRSIPGGSANGSYEIPNSGKMSKSS